MPTIEMVVVGAEPVPQSLVNLWTSAEPTEAGSQRQKPVFVQTYGPTEVALSFCVANTMKAFKTRGNEIGRGFRAATWIVNKHDDSELMPIGAEGELLLEGPCVARGYLNRLDLTAQAFIDSSPRWSRPPARPCGRLYKTGDLVRYTHDGSLLYLGRKDEQIKIHGIRTELGDIESRLSAAIEPQLRDISPIPIVVDLLKGLEKSFEGAGLLVAFVHVSDGDAYPSKEGGGRDAILGSPENPSFQAIVRSILRHEQFHTTPLPNQLPRHMMPQAFVPILSLPKTSSDKIDRQALRRSVRELPRHQLLCLHTSTVGRSCTSDGHDQQPSTLKESQLAEIWKQILRVDSVSPSVNFFRLGGDSLAAIALKARVHRVLGHNLSLADIFAYPVLRVMAAKMEHPEDEEAGGSDDCGGNASSIIEPFSLLGFHSEEDITNNTKHQFLSDIVRECGNEITSSDIQDVMPCTPMQEALMAVSAHSSTTAGGGRYSVQVPYRLSEDIDMDAFHEAWELVVKATSILRSRIVFLAGYGSLLVICRPSPPTVKRLQLSSSIEDYLETIRASQSFGYGTPLFRLCILEAGPRDAVRQASGDNDDQIFHCLILSAHHAVYDGWSLRLLWADVLKTYGAVKSGGLISHVPTDSPPFEVLVRHLQRQPKTTSERFWSSLFERETQVEDADGAIKDPGMEFPSTPTQHQPLATRRKTFALEAPSAETILQTQIREITPTSVVQSAWAIVLAQYSARRTVSFGCTLSGRDLRIRGIEDLRGPTMTVVPFQVALTDAQSALDFVRHVQGIMTSMIPHEHLGLQNIQQLSAAAHRACAFTSLLTVQPPDDEDHDADSDEPGRKNKEMPTVEHPSRELGISLIDSVDVSGFHPLPLALQIFRNRSLTKMVAEVSFDPQCLDEALLEQVMGHFKHVLRMLWCQIAGGEWSPGGSLADVLRSSSKAHQAQMAVWNFIDVRARGGTQAKPGNNSMLLLHGMFERQAVQQPDAPAIVSHDGSYTYGELDQAADSLAAKIFRLNGCKTDQNGPLKDINPLGINPVGLCFEHSATALVAMLAVLKAGAPFLPLSPTNPPARLAEMASDAGCLLILVSPSLQNMFPGEGLVDLESRAQRARRVLVVDQPLLNSLRIDVRSDSEVRSTKTRMLKHEICGLSADHLAYILFTSGSTGRPKGVKMQHGACAAAIGSLSDRFGLDMHTRRLQFTDYSFDNSIEDVFGTLSVGGCVCVPSDSERVNDLAAFCRTQRVNSLHVTPSVLRLLLSNGDGELGSGTGITTNLPDIKSCVVGGEPLTQRDVELIDRWIQSSRRHLRVFYAYGSTETCIDCTATEIVPPQPSLKPSKGEIGETVTGDAFRSRSRNIGRSINPALWRTWIVSTLSGSLAPLGAVGELCVEGPALAQGYLEAPASQLTQQRSESNKSTKFVRRPSWHPAAAAAAAEDLSAPNHNNSNDIRVYHTGDMARYESDGTILYLGRLDGQVKINGKRLELGEVEDHIMRSVRQHATLGVREVAVGLCHSNHLHAVLMMKKDGFAGSSKQPQADDTWEHDEALDIRFSTSGIAAETGAELHQNLMRALPSHMIPQSFIAVDKIPATTSGKRDRRRINEFVQNMCHNSTVPGLDGEEAGDYAKEWELHGKEALLQAWWAEALASVACPKRIAPTAHFFSLGANSITAIKLAGLARRSGYLLKYEDIFLFPILSDMGMRMEAAVTQGRELPAEQDYSAFGLLTAEECESVLSSAAEEYGIARDLIQDAYPCTPLQSSLLAATARNPGTYIMAEQVKTSWKSLQRTKAAFERALSMFETFRACIIPTPGPTSAAHSHMQIVLHHPPAWREDTSVEALVDLVRAEFGYGQPLVRMGVVPPQPQNQHEGGNTGDGVGTIVLIAHHAAYDGPSFDLFWAMVNENLSHPDKEPVNEFPGVGLFSSFVKHMESHFDAESARTWWKTDLDGFGDEPCFLTRHDDLPVTRNHHKPLATSVRHQSVQLPPHKPSEAVKTTLAVTARAAWSLTLSHFTASTDTVYGAGISVLGATVGKAPFTQVAGPTITTVPSRSCIDYDETVAQFLDRIHRHAATETQFAYLGLHAIASESPACRKACEFDNIFVIQQQQSTADGVKDGGGSGQQHKDPRKLSTSHYLGKNQARLVGAEAFYPHPVVVTCYPHESEKGPDDQGQRTRFLDIDFIYDPILVPEEHAEAILDTFATILRHLADDSQKNAPLRDVGALSETGLGSVLNLVRPDLRLPRNKKFLHHLVDEQARRRPSGEAVCAWNGRLTYQELDKEASFLAARVTRLLAFLQPVHDGTEERGWKPIAFLLDKATWPIITMLAIMKAGCAFLPLDKRYPLQRMQNIVEVTGVQLLVTQKTHEEVTGQLGCELLFIEDLSEDPVGNVPETHKVDKTQLSTADPDTSAAYILFTSGSTGTPKGVVMPHSSLCNALLGLAQAGDAPLTESSRVLQFSSYTFDASMWEIFSTLISGGTVCVPSEHDRLDSLENAICTFSVDEAMLTPSVARIIDPFAVAGCLRTLRLCGEAISIPDRARWTSPELGIRVVGAYGTTESGIVSHYHHLNPREASHKGIGKSIYCRSWVVNPLKHSELAPRGAVGELYIEGWVLARGYIGDEGKTAASFIANPSWMPAPPDIVSSPNISSEDQRQEGSIFYKTGDLVYYGRDGTLIYVGRRDPGVQIKLRGQRIELGEVEAAVQDAVQSSASSIDVDIPTAVELFTPHQGMGSQTLGVAFAVGKLQGRGDLNTHKVCKQLSETLPAYMIPTQFITLDQLPLSGSGKLDRTALRALLASPLATEFSTTTVSTQSSEGDSRTVGRVLEPLSDTERKLRPMLAEILHVSDVDRISSTDNFFSLGGDSIGAMRLASVARRRGFEIHVADIFAHPTIAGIASHARPCRPRQRHLGSSENSISNVESFREVAEACGVPAESIEAIYPCTSSQVVLRRHAVRFYFALARDVEVDRLRKAVERCVAAYPILRTRIVPCNGTDDYVQAVMKYTCEPIEWTLRDGLVDSQDLDKTEGQEVPSKNFMAISIQVAGGELENGVGQESCSSRCFIWTLCHAFYDGWSLNLIAQSVEQVYRDSSFALAPSLPFSEFVHYQARQRETAAKDQFWETYLSGVPRRQSLLFDYDQLGSHNGKQDLGLESPLQRDEKAHYHLRTPKLAGTAAGVTEAAVIVAAWAMAVGAATQTQDLTIAYVVSGRSASLAGIETCVGPTVCRVPLRIRLPVLSEGSPHCLVPTATHVQEELTRVMPYELSGLDGLRLLSESPQLATAVVPLEIVVQPRSSVLKAERFQEGKADLGQRSQQRVGLGRGQGEKLLQLVKMEAIRGWSGGFLVEVSLSDDEEEGVEMVLSWDRRASDKGRVDELVARIKEILGL